MKTYLALLALVFAACAPAASAQTQQRALTANFTAKLGIIDVGTFNFAYTQTGDAYSITASRRSGFQNQNYDYSSHGAVAVDGALRPVGYQHQGGKPRPGQPHGRLVEVSFNGDDIQTRATPPMGAGQYPVPPQPSEQRGAIDQLTAIASLVTARGDPCGRTVRVFMDGRARFDFVIANSQRVNGHWRAYHGEALRCRVVYRPVSGFSEQQEQRNVTFLFAPTSSGMYAPLRLEMPSDHGTVVLEARAVTVNGVALPNP